MAMHLTTFKKKRSPGISSSQGTCAEGIHGPTFLRFRKRDGPLNQFMEKAATSGHALALAQKPTEARTGDQGGAMRVDAGLVSLGLFAVLAGASLGWTIGGHLAGESGRMT